MYYRVYLTIKENGYVLSSIYFESETKSQENSPRTCDLIDLNNFIQKSVELETDEKTRETTLTPDHEITLDSLKNELFSFTTKKNPADTHLGQKPTKKTNIGKLH